MAISLSAAAARHVTRYLAKRGSGVGVRLGVKTTGCSGLAYKLEYVDEIAPDALLIPHRLHSDVQRCRHELADQNVTNDQSTNTNHLNTLMVWAA